MLKLTNYIREMYKQFCDLIDSVSVKMLIVLGCSVHVALETHQQHVNCFWWVWLFIQGSLSCISTLRPYILIIENVYCSLVYNWFLQKC